MDLYYPWWYNFFVAGIVGATVGVIYYFLHPAIAVGLVAAIGYYIILDRTDERCKFLQEKVKQ